MPKSTNDSPTSNHSQSKQSADDQAARLSDVALRKKKNADAQAAFRARRANYIATLEETVTNLESVVIHLQDSCRGFEHTEKELRRELNRVVSEYANREMFWRSLWQAKKNGDTCDDLPPLPPFFASNPELVNPSASLGPPVQTYGAPSLAYRGETQLCGPVYGGGSSTAYQDATASQFSGTENDMSADGHRYSPCSYNTHRDGTWPQSIAPSNSSGAESGPPQTQPHSPAFVESPSLNPADVPYRFPVEDQKMPMNNVDTAHYMFHHGRSSSPPNSTPGSTSSTSATLTSPFQFAFPDNAVNHDRPDFNYRRHSHPHTAEVTLHGGTADLSLTGSPSDGVRYRLDARRGVPGTVLSRALLPALPLTGCGTSLQHERGSSDGDLSPYPRLRPRRGLSRSSRSPSPGAAPRSATLAVIKAQAFGALRRTRARTKRASDGASKVSLDVLEARGIQTGAELVVNGSKRQRVDADDMDLQSKV
ncbi:hypothetical protein AX16_009525 [Volvariella volvacea WC 439]|nr:hypothetical protein AX16_009525 [Volvariella volvacea WC 439]